MRLQTLTAALSQGVTCEQVADAILKHAEVVLGASAGVVARLSDDGSELVCLHATGYSAEVVNALNYLPADTRLPLADAVRQRQPVLLANLAEQNARYPEMVRLTGVPAEGAVVALPLVVRDRTIGGIGLRFPTERIFTEQDRAFLLTIAGLCAQALERAQLYDTERAARERAEQAEYALRESDERFVRFMQHLPGLAWIKDAEGRYVYANDAAVKAFGKPRTGIYGRMDEEVFPPPIAAQFRENDRKALANGAGVRVVETLEHQDGFLHYSVVSKFPIPGPDGAAALVGGMAIDITEEMRTQAVLEESEERFRATFDQAAVGIAHVGLDGRWLRVNRKFCDIVRYRPDELLALTFQDITYPEDLEADLAQVRRLLAGEIETYSMEKRYFRKDRSLVWINLTVALVRTPQAQPKYFISVVEDITQDKQVREALRESENRLRTLSDNLPLGAVYQEVGEANVRRRLLYVSAGVERLLGVAPAEALADAAAVYNLVHPEDAPRLAAAEEVALRTLTPFDCEFRSWTRSGGLIWLHARSAPRPLPNGQVVWEGILFDVTTRKRAEQASAQRSEQLRRLAEVATRINTAGDLAAVMRLVTEEARRLIGSHQAVTGFTTDQNWEQAFNAMSLSDKYALWRGYDTKPDGSGIYALVCRTNRPMRLTQAELEAHPAWRGFSGETGRHPPMRGWLAAPLVGRDGRNIGLLQLSDKYEGEFTEDDEAVLVQLAQLASVAFENARLVESLRDADRRKDEFLATLAHELRNPLAPLRNGLQVMKMASGNVAAVEQARTMMERQLGQMVHLIDDLLDVSRITRGKLQLRRERIDLASIVQSAVEGSRPLIEASGHRLAISLPSEPVFLDADPTRLAQVFANLLTNAAKYTDQGGRITLSATRESSEVIVAVKDTGIGISPEQLPRLFEMFSQVKAALERSQGGLGIGLSLVKGLVEMHGGNIVARSEGLGKGSEFIVRLPVMRVSPAPESPTADRGEKAAVRCAKRILVADDNRDAAHSLAMMLRLAGQDVHAVHDGQEAVEAAAWFRPDLALLDIGMPKLNGFEAARHIREQPWGKNMVLVAITGWGQEEDKRRATEAGFDLHLTKPADPAALEKLLAGLKTS
jgi:PAS domain S-box-containing protein